MRVRLRVVKGKNAGRDIKIQGASFLVGRSEECHLRPKSDAISRRHTEITVEDASVWVRDLGSKNGTFVDDERVTERRELFDGNMLRIGKLEFTVVIQAPTPAPAEKAAGGTVSADDWQEDDVSSWLAQSDEEERARRLAEPETRQFKIDDTMRQKKADDDETQASDADSDTADTVAKNDPGEDSSTSEDTTGFFLSKKKKKTTEKKKPGKLPDRPKEAKGNSKTAAEDMLRKFFNNR